MSFNYETAGVPVCWLDLEMCGAHTSLRVKEEKGDRTTSLLPLPLGVKEAGPVGYPGNNRGGRTYLDTLRLLECPRAPAVAVREMLQVAALPLDMTRAGTYSRVAVGSMASKNGVRRAYCKTQHPPS